MKLRSEPTESTSIADAIESLPKGVPRDGVASRDPGAFVRFGGEFWSCLWRRERRGVGDGENVAIQFNRVCLSVLECQVAGVASDVYAS